MTMVTYDRVGFYVTQITFKISRRPSKAVQ